MKLQCHRVAKISRKLKKNNNSYVKFKNYSAGLKMLISFSPVLEKINTY